VSGFPSTGTPKFTMVGVDRPGGGCRLYASRDLKRANFGHVGADDDRSYSGAAWHVETDMQHVLIIDRPTWGEAFSHAFTIWANEDAETERRELAEARERRLAEAARQQRALDAAHPLDKRIEDDMARHGFSGEMP
jgi:hypothetical protein